MCSTACKSKTLACAPAGWPLFLCSLTLEHAFDKSCAFVKNHAVPITTCQHISGHCIALRSAAKVCIETAIVRMYLQAMPVLEAIGGVCQCPDSLWSQSASNEIMQMLECMQLALSTIGTLCSAADMANTALLSNTCAWQGHK